MTNLEKDFDFFKKNVEKNKEPELIDSKTDLTTEMIIEFSKGVSFVTSFYIPIIFLLLFFHYFSSSFKQEDAIYWLTLLGKNFFSIIVFIHFIFESVKSLFTKKLLSPLKYLIIFSASNHIYNIIEFIVKTLWSNI